MKRSGQLIGATLLGTVLLACSASVSDRGENSAGSTGAPSAGSSGQTTSPGAGASSTGGAGSTPTAGVGGVTSGTGGSTISVGGASVEPMPVEPVQAASALRKVKNLLVGLPPDAAELDKVTASGAAGLQELIAKWVAEDATLPLFRDKMIGFFRNAFQQTGFIPTEDFKRQLLENGGLDFGPFGTGAVGDDIYFRLVQNLQDSFAQTAWAIVAEGRPFTEVVTTQRFQMTTILKSTYLQIEMPNDQPYAFGAKDKIPWKVNYDPAVTIPIEQAITDLTFDDQPPAAGGTMLGGGMFMNCRDMPAVREFTGYAQMFQRLIGYTPRYPFAANPECWEHSSKPYFTVSDTTDWQWVTIKPRGTAAYVQPYDIPTLRTAKELALSLPRVGFFTTPAFLALWNTNDSNQHRVTANQTLLVALGRSFTSDLDTQPVTNAGLNAEHATTSTECNRCHRHLDPLRQFWSNTYDYNDRNDFPARASFTGAAANPRPAAGITGGALSFANVAVDKTQGGSMSDLAELLLQVQGGSGNDAISMFALGMTQKLCFYANSAACLVDEDPEVRRIAKAFQDSKYSFPVLVREFFSSPIVTSAASTKTFETNGMVVSIARRAQLCAALSNRLGRPDICAQAVPVPTGGLKTTNNIAGNIPADAFGRGSENPITPTSPTLFFRAASEMLCEDVANQIVDSATNPVYKSADSAGAIEDMVTRIVGYPPNDSHHAQAVQLLTEHFNAARSSGANATNSLKSTFAAACQAPTSVAIGL